MERRRIGPALAGLGFLAGALALHPALVAHLTQDGEIAPPALLSLAMARWALAGLGLVLLLWVDLSDPRRRLWLVGALLVLTVGPRAVLLDSPYLDHQCWRQCDTASIARNFHEKSPNIFLPEVNWRADAPNYVESELQILPWLTAMGYRITGERPWVGRAIVVAFAALGTLAVFGLTSHYLGQATGFFAAIFWALSPLSVYFGRTFLPDTPSLALALAGLWGVAHGLRANARGIVLAAAGALALALLIKVVALYIYFPLAVVLLEHYGRDVTRQPLAWLVAGVPILAAAAYYAWAYYLGLHYLSFGIFGGLC